MAVAAVSAGLGALTSCAPVDYCADTNIAKDGALFASQTFAKDRLTSPGSAKFPTSSTERGVLVVRTGTCDFRVMSWVDSQNGFGALLRSTYYATVTPDAQGRYTLQDITIE